MKKLTSLLVIVFLYSTLFTLQSFSQNGDGSNETTLNHMVQGSFSYTQMTGNVNANNFGASINGALWGSSFSNLIFIRGNLQNVETGDSKVNYKMYDVLNLLRLNISGNFFGVGAFDFEKNEPILIERRFSGFIGAGYDLIVKPDNNLSVIAAVGRTSESNTVPVQNPYDAFTSIFLMNSYDAKVTENFSITQQFDFFAPIDDLERSRIRLSFSANTTIYKMMGVSYRLNLNYYRDPLVSLTELQRNESLDFTQTIALTIQL